MSRTNHQNKLQQFVKFIYSEMISESFNNLPNKELTDYVEKLGHIHPSILTLLLCSIPLIQHLVLLRTKNYISKRNI